MYVAGDAKEKRKGRMRNLHIDLETKSRVNLKLVGVDVYANHPTTEILMMAYAWEDHGPVSIWCPHLGPMPLHIQAALTDATVQKHAWNVNFEFNVLTHKAGFPLVIDQWFDPAAHARALGFPANLADAGAIVGVGVEHEKSKEGKALLKLFSEPTKAKKPTKKNPAGVPSTFNDWTTHPKEWAEFEEYCKQDVIAERAVAAGLTALCPFQEQEYPVWVLDQKINARGIPIDLDFTAKALALVENTREAILYEMQTLTHVENPNSRDQLLEWLQAHGYQYEKVDKECVAAALDKADYIDEVAKQVLDLKQTLGGIAFKKLPVIQQWTREDRLRYAFLYHSAHTGRWSSKGVQFHNLLKPTKRVAEHYDEIVAAIMSGGSIPAGIPTVEAVAGTLRAAVHARPGHKLYVADYSSVENRVLAWFAKCPGMLDVFKQGLDPYKAFAALYYNIPYDQVTKEQRNFCKSPVLGCGYGMGPGRLIGYAAGMGQTIEDDDAYKLVHGWREAYPEVPEYWDKVGNAAIKAVLQKKCFSLGKLQFNGWDEKMFKIILPSGRELHYCTPQIGRSRFHQPVLTYMADDVKLGWTRIEARGSALVENIVQAASRDLLVNGMKCATEVGFDIVLHVHDELVSEVPLTSVLTYGMFDKAMTTNPAWGEDIPLKVDGYEGQYYKKA